jgi:bifunctional non-homologous end joining protein LigD
MLRRALPAGFVVPAQPVERNRSPSGPEWVHEIKHDGYRLILRREDERVRLYSRQANDWTDRLPAIAVGALRIKAQSFTLDGEAVVVGPDGLSQFEALRRRDAGQVAVLFAFDLIEHDGVDLRGHPFVARKAMLTHLLCDRVGHIQLNEHIAEDAHGSSSTHAGSEPRASCRSGSTRHTVQGHAQPGSR